MTYIEMFASSTLVCDGVVAHVGGAAADGGAVVLLAVGDVAVAVQSQSAAETIWVSIGSRASVGWTRTTYLAAKRMVAMENFMVDLKKGLI